MCAKNILRKKAVGAVLSLDQESPDVLLGEIYSSLGPEPGQGGFLKESLLVIISPFILSRPSLNCSRLIQAENATEISLAF